MAYEPGKAWDPSIAYEPGQWCIYNGLPYTVMYGFPSTPGEKPNVEEQIFDSETESRADRVWTIGEPIGNGVRYGSVKRLQFPLRGIRGITLDGISYPFQSGRYHLGVIPGYWSPKDQGTVLSEEYYGQDYRGQSAEMGKATIENPMYDGNGNIVVSYVDEDFSGQFGSLGGSGWMPYLVNLGVDPSQPAGTVGVKLIFKAQPIDESGLNTFHRTATYNLTVTATDTSVSPPVTTTTTTTHTVSSGDVRDDWYDESTYTANEHYYTNTATMTYTVTYVLTGITPRMDA